MKKVLIISMFVMSFAGSAFAATGALSTNSPCAPGEAVFGGDSPTTASNAVNPLVRFSTGVRGLVNFLAAGTPVAVVTSYALVAKHDIGSKVFGTANDSTNIYWKQSPSKVVLTGTIAGAAVDNSNFATEGWTAY